MTIQGNGGVGDGSGANDDDHAEGGTGNVARGTGGLMSEHRLVTMELSGTTHLVARECHYVLCCFQASEKVAESPGLVTDRAA